MSGQRHAVKGRVAFILPILRIAFARRSYSSSTNIIPKYKNRSPPHSAMQNCARSVPIVMSSSIKNVIFVGAGGHLGPSILAVFDADPQFTVSVLARQSSKSVFPSHIKVHRVADNYPEVELLQAFKGQDAIVSTIATAEAFKQQAIIDAAIKAGVKRFVPSEFGSDTLIDKAVAILPQYFEGKTKTVEYLKSKEKDGLTWTAFVTGPFFEL